MKRVLNLLLIASMAASVAFGGLSKNPKSLRKPARTTVVSDNWMNANRMNGTMRNNGTWFYDYVTGDWGLEWPKGSGLSPIFAGGQWISAKVGDEVRLAGVIHSASEFQAGEIINGEPANPLDGKYKWYVIQPGGVGDWDNWPVDQGAPVDKDGKPMLIGDKTAFCVWNDLGEHSLFGTNKLGAEVRQTAFAFNRADAMGDMIFIKWQIINKSAADWDSTYISIWTDPDLGGATDDFVGCDPELGLGFCYNADNEDQNYGAAPPAVGIDFFQGPIVDQAGSSVTLPDGTVLNDKTMKKMTAFIYYNNNDSPQGEPNTSSDVWNYLRGYWKDNSIITDPDGNRTPFMFNGDPEQNTGWLDKDEADRRFLMSSGPFTMPKWEDTNGNGRVDFGEPGVQEIVAGIIVARGADNLNSVTTLKTVDGLAQMAYDLNFLLAKAPALPEVTVSNPPNGTILTWNEKSEFNEDGTPYESADPIVAQAYEDTVIIDNTVVVIDDSTYNFYGYTVYQYSDASGANPVVLGHWDNGGSNDAVPYAGPRFLRITVNKHNMVGVVGDPLINGKEYYFGVRAHGYLRYGAPVVFDGAATIVTVVPQFVPGARYSCSFNDTLEVTHTGVSDGSVVAWVVDPSKVTGSDYSITFNSDLTWNWLRNGVDVLEKNQTNQTGDEAYTVHDGLMVKVLGPDPGMKSWEIPSGTRRFSPVNGFTGLNLEGFSSGADPLAYDLAKGTMGMAGHLIFGGIGTSLGVAQYHNVVLKLAAVDNIALWDPKTQPSDPNFSKSYRWLRRAADPAQDPSFEPWITTPGSGYPLQGFDWGVPFSAWDMETDPPTRLAVGHFENNVVGGLVDGRYWPGTAADENATNTTWRELCFIFNKPYSETPDPELEINLSNSVTPMMWVITCARRAEVAWAAGDEFRINASHVNATTDVYTFTAPASGAPKTVYMKEDMAKINVVPNPYYGFHSGEMNAFARWVQFTYLPKKCTIRIFDLAGNMVRKLEKNDPNATLLQWDLENEYQLPVASGIYVYQVDAPDLGKKIGKIAIFTPNERLDTY